MCVDKPPSLKFGLVSRSFSSASLAQINGEGEIKCVIHERESVFLGTVTLK